MKYLKFACEFLLMHFVCFMWKVFPMSQEDMTLFDNNRWVFVVICSVLAIIIGFCIGVEVERDKARFSVTIEHNTNRSDDNA